MVSYNNPMIRYVQAMASVVKAIQETDRGLNPLVEGSVIRIPIPKLARGSLHITALIQCLFPTMVDRP